MNEFIGCYKKRAKARYKGRNERALARFSWQRPISIGGDGDKQVIIGIAREQPGKVDIVDYLTCCLMT